MTKKIFISYDYDSDKHYKNLLKAYTNPKKKSKFKTSMSNYDYGLCVYLIGYYKTFTNSSITETMEALPELSKQQPPLSAGWWWDRREKQPRIDAIKAAIKLTESNIKSNKK